MKKQITMLICDVCKKEIGNDDEKYEITYHPSVTSPTPSQHSFDVCSNECLNKLPVKEYLYNLTASYSPTVCSSSYASMPSLGFEKWVNRFNEP